MDNKKHGSGILEVNNLIYEGELIMIKMVMVNYLLMKIYIYNGLWYEDNIICNDIIKHIYENNIKYELTD